MVLLAEKKGPQAEGPQVDYQVQAELRFRIRTMWPLLTWHHQHLGATLWGVPRMLWRQSIPMMSKQSTFMRLQTMTSSPLRRG